MSCACESLRLALFYLKDMIDASAHLGKAQGSLSTAKSCCRADLESLFHWCRGVYHQAQENT